MEACSVGIMGRSRWKFQRGLVYSIWGNARDLRSHELLCEVVRSLTLEAFEETRDDYIFWIRSRERIRHNTVISQALYNSEIQLSCEIRP